MNVDRPHAAISATFNASAMHGRDAERTVLQSVLSRIQATGVTEILMISGSGGMGKSTLAHCLLSNAQHAAAPIGVGKCDQLNAAIPFAAIAEVVRMLTLEALGGEQTALDRLSARWRGLLGGTENAVTELVPEAGHILGSAGPAVSVLTPQGQARIERALLRTLEAFSELGKPAVVFLDDLQWADEATLSFLKAFIGDPPGNVLFVGAYRTNDSRFAQWYAQVKHATRQADTLFTDIAVTPLSHAAFENIVTDVLAQPGKSLGQLVDGLHTKSGGNPYFGRQLLQSWIDDGVLKPEEDGWTWIESAIESSGYADHVVDLLIQRIARLPPGPKQVLEHLSCIGIHGHIELVAAVCAMGSKKYEQAIDQLIASGMLTRRGDVLAFQHDRVLEATYALIPAEEKSPRHKHIARTMMVYWSDKIASMAYEIGNQIEKVRPVDISDAEKPGFVRILLVAARRAQRASAIDRAYDYNMTAASLMNAAWWNAEFALAYESALIKCECLIAKAELAKASTSIDAMLVRPMPGHERARLHRLEAVLHTLRSDYDRAIDAALAGLALLGIRLQRDPTPAEMREAYDSVIRAVNGKPISELGALPICGDEKVRDAMALLATLIASFFTPGNIRFTHLAKLVELTLRHGVSPDSPYGLAWFGVFIASYYDQFDDGYAFGQAALSVVDRNGFESARISALVALDQVAVWTQPLALALDYVEQAATRGMQSGELGMACYACNHIVSDMLVMGMVLPLVEDAAQSGIALTKSIGYVDVELIIASQLDFIHVMTRGYPHGDFIRWAETCHRRARSATSLPTKFWTWLYAGLASMYEHRWQLALEFLQPAMGLISAAPAHINVADCHLFHALAVSRSDNESREAKTALLRAERARFGLWSKHNAGTFLNKFQLLEGELARIEGDHLKAMMFFEMSSRTARAAGFVHEQAFAHELAAMTCREQGLAIAAFQHLRMARSAYLRWGARWKAEAIQLADPDEAETAQADASESNESQDNSALQFGLKAARALSQESVKEKLVETMFADLLAQASAQYGVLIKVSDGVPMIEASGRLTNEGILTSVAVVTPDQSIIPMRLMNTVLRTQRSIIIHDAISEVLPLRGRHEDAAALRSVLCLPLLRAGELVGLLYLENNLAPGVFNPARIRRLELMASQIAIALGFARLYEQLIASDRARTEAETNLHIARAELVKNVHVTVLANLAASIAHEINQPLGAIVISAQATLRWLNRSEPDVARIQTGLERIIKDGLRAGEIIKALRGLAAKSMVELESIHVADLISGVVSLLADELNGSNIAVELQLNPDVVVTGDRVQLQQVILNLLNNAVEAMLGCRKDLTHRLKVSMHMVEYRLQIIVQDSGPGIAEDDLERIFQPFYTTKGSGLGMGLAICTSIAEAHGGTLTARNMYGGGTAFVLEIPANAENPR